MKGKLLSMTQTMDYARSCDDRDGEDIDNDDIYQHLTHTGNTEENTVELDDDDSLSDATPNIGNAGVTNETEQEFNIPNAEDTPNIEATGVTLNYNESDKDTEWEETHVNSSSHDRECNAARLSKQMDDQFECQYS